ncbi:MAG: rRNA processing protein RimM [Bacteroidetes bacterium]|jgi:16S rRNA processing protein RimM|nr:rRNA processing protein RimM [Bacteroidota bacterium]
MISHEEVFPIGQITKPHGINGEMSFSFTSDVFDTEDVPFLILEIDGILVPFFLEEHRFKSNTTALIKLEGIESDEKARQLAGLTVFLPKKYLEMVDDAEIELDYFTGFELIDEQRGRIGTISEVDQTTDNALFVIGSGKDELLIPVGDEYIVSIDHDKKIIHVELPEGLLDL